MGWRGWPSACSRTWRHSTHMRLITLPRIRPTRPILPTLLLLPLLGVLAACGAGTSGGTGNLTPLTVGLTYVPNIQFAPFYVADAKGYYRDAGLKVSFHHHNASEDEFGA